MSNNTTCRIGIGGPVGSGKTALIEAITPRLLDMGYKVLVITNDVVTTEDAKHVRKMLKGVLVEERIIGVETGACPHTAVREDPSMNIAAGLSEKRLTFLIKPLSHVNSLSNVSLNICESYVKFIISPCPIMYGCTLFYTHICVLLVCCFVGRLFAVFAYDNT